MSKISERNSRYLFAFVAAVLPTVALFYLMTRLIVPDEGDSVVADMIDAYNLRFISRTLDNAVMRRELELMNNDDIAPPKRSDFLPPVSTDGGEDVEIEATQRTENIDEQQDKLTDWWKMAEDAVNAMNENDVRQWRLSHGYDTYVSIMQGPMPSSPYPKPRRITEDAIGTGYVGASGMLEVKVSDNCVMYINNSAVDQAFRYRRPPPQIVCKSARPKIDFNRYKLED